MSSIVVPFHRLPGVRVWLALPLGLVPPQREVAAHGVDMLDKVARIIIYCRNGRSARQRPKHWSPWAIPTSWRWMVVCGPGSRRATN